MTLTLELTPEEKARLQVLADRQGLDLNQYARTLLGLQPAGEYAAPRNEAEWEQLEAELAEGVDPEIPQLSEEALSRASIYGHRA